jgi:ABC-2 type transport system permease protein
MKALITHLGIQLRLDFRNRGTLLVFYIIPLVFYIVMGAVFSSITPDTKETLGGAMTIFAITMGAVLGIPPTLVEMRESGTLRAYRVNGVPGWAVLLAKSLSACINLIIVSVIIAITAPLLFGAGIPAHIGAYSVTILLLVLASIALGNLIGVLAKTQSATTILSQAVFLPSLLLSGIMFPAAMLPDVLRWVGKIFPASYAMGSLSTWAFGSGPFPAANGIILGIGVLGAFIALLRFKVISRTA